MSVFARCKGTRYGGDCRPDIHGILIPGKRGRLLSVLYTAGEPGPHPTVLLLHGIPGCERNFDLAQALRRAGFHVLVFHYSGSWGSDGDYSLTHDLEDADTVLDYLVEDTAHGIDKERIYAVGHSMGGFVCAHLTAHRAEIRAGVLMLPCDIGRFPQIAASDAAAAETIRQVLEDSAPWLNGTSGKALLEETVAHSQEFRLEGLAEPLSKKPVLCVAGSLDVYTPPEHHCVPLERAVQKQNGVLFRLVSYPTDHFFSDCRETVAQTVKTFLLEQLSVEKS